MEIQNNEFLEGVLDSKVKDKVNGRVKTFRIWSLTPQGHEILTMYFSVLTTSWVDTDDYVSWRVRLLFNIKTT